MAGKRILPVLLCLFCLFFAGCSPLEKVILAEERGYAEGVMGDLLGTEWFTIRVNKAALTDRYYDAVKADRGEKLAVINLTLESTIDRDVTVFDTDFQLQWGETDDGYGYPVTAEDPSLSAEGMMEKAYTLKARQKKTGNLVFRVPEGWNEFWLAFQEFYDTEEEGNTFFIFVQAK